MHGVGADQVDVVAGLERAAQDHVVIDRELHSPVVVLDLGGDARVLRRREHGGGHLLARVQVLLGDVAAVQRLLVLQCADDDVLLHDRTRLNLPARDRISDARAGGDVGRRNQHRGGLLRALGLLLDVAGVHDHQKRCDAGQNQRDRDVADVVRHAAASLTWDGRRKT